MLLIGHRGCNYAGYNQNTIRSFERVASEGVPAIEFDVQLCADGELVVVHNLALEEVSTGKGKVSETDAATLRQLYAGDPSRGEDRIPFLSEVFDFFAAKALGRRPVIHMELKGHNTGRPAGELYSAYVASGRLQTSDLLVSSFGWRELEALQQVCPGAKIALLDGAIRRNTLLEKTGTDAERYFPDLFAYGNEDYMLPRFASLEENLALLDTICLDPRIHSILADEIHACLSGRYYSDALLDAAQGMGAVSVNLWYRTLFPQFVEKAHARGLAVFVYTVNDADDLRAMAAMGVDGVFTDRYTDAVEVLAQNGTGNS
jgi:glycerophosphoryl diester phosphodiesterase